MSQPPPPIYSNYPRQSLQLAWPIRPANVYYFDAIGDAWTAMTAQLGVWLPVALIIGLGYALMVALQFAITMPAIVSTRGPAEMENIQIASTLFQTLPYSVLMCLIAGALATGVRQLNGEVINVGMMFSGFRRYGSMLALSGFHCGLSAVGQLAFRGLGFRSDLASLPQMLIPILGMIVGYILYTLVIYPLIVFVPVDLVMSPERRLFDAIREAYSRTWSPILALKFLLLNFIGVLLIVAGECMCFVGLLFAGPLTLLLYALHYRYFYPPIFRTEVARQVSIGDLPPQ